MLGIYLCTSEETLPTLVDELEIAVTKFEYIEVLSPTG